MPPPIYKNIPSFLLYYKKKFLRAKFTEIKCKGEGQTYIAEAGRTIQ
jgi:hypothetical protein